MHQQRDGVWSSIEGGYERAAVGELMSIVAGESNTIASADVYSAILGGSDNTLSGTVRRRPAD